MQPPLPQRIWLPWDACPGACTLSSSFELGARTRVRLGICSSGAATVRVGGHLLEPEGQAMPPFRVMRWAAIELDPGRHEVSVAAEPGPNGQPFVLLVIDAVDGERLLATGEDWTGRPGLHEQGPGQGEACSPAWSAGGPWCEPWGLPCDAPLDFGRLGTGWQQVLPLEPALEPLTFDGLAPLGARAEVLAGGALAFTVAEPHAPRTPQLPEVQPEPTWYRTREQHSRATNRFLELYDARCPRVVQDLGRPAFAQVTVRVLAGGPAILAVCSGESRGELEGSPARVADVVRLEDGQTFTTAPTGLRFVQIQALGHGGARLELAPLELHEVRPEVEPVGTFESSDPLLEAIFERSRETLALCMQNEIWDGIRRDQLPWMGDLQVEALAAFHAFGDTRLVGRSLEVLGDLAPGPSLALADESYPGLARAWATDEPDLNGIPSYTLWWLVGVHDHAVQCGAEELVRRLAPRLVATVDHVLAHLDDEDRWQHRTGWDFVDWAPLTSEERTWFCHLLAAHALACGASLLEALEPAASARARDGAARLGASARRLRSAWAGGAHHLPAMALRAGIVEGPDARALYDERLGRDEPLRMTFWHRYGDLEAARLVGDIAGGLASLRRHWEPCLRAETGALWEAFEEEWLAMPDPHAVSVVGPDHARYGGYETSLCHGWSAGPIVWLHQAVLGVVHLGPRALRWAPDLGGLEWAEGVVPTVAGPVRVRLDRGDEGGLQGTLFAPEGVSVEVDPATPHSLTVLTGCAEAARGSLQPEGVA
jgi:hypothetical protein